MRGIGGFFASIGVQLKKPRNEVAGRANLLEWTRNNAKDPGVKLGQNEGLR
jgi:hypothetical protein